MVMIKARHNPGAREHVCYSAANKPRVYQLNISADTTAPALHRSCCSTHRQVCSQKMEQAQKNRKPPRGQTPVCLPANQRLASGPQPRHVCLLLTAC